MSFDQFQQWYTGGETGKIVKQASETAAGTVTLEELKRISGLGRRSAAEVMEMFAEVTDHEGYVSMEEFAKVFERLVDEEDVSSDDLDKLHVALGRLFETMDVNGDGKVDFVELSSGISTLTGGSVDEKTRAAFALYDVNGDGFISLSEFEHYLTSVFKFMYVSLYQSPTPKHPNTNTLEHQQVRTRKRHRRSHGMRTDRTCHRYGSSGIQGMRHQLRRKTFLRGIFQMVQHHGR
jgi:Ca2+-binding EF-hand superfamily protein